MACSRPMLKFTRTVYLQLLGLFAGKDVRAIIYYLRQEVL